MMSAERIEDRIKMVTSTEFRWNPQGDYPQADNTAYIDSTAIIIGKVNIGRNVFIGPGVVLRADEPSSSISIEDNCNVQDRVIIHSSEDSTVLVGESTSLTHGCIIHGPCKIGKRCFVGFGSVVFNAVLEEGVIVKHLAVVEGVNVFSERVVESSQLVNCEDEAGKLRHAGKKERDFTGKVIKTNLELTEKYRGK